MRIAKINLLFLNAILSLLIIEPSEPVLADYRDALSSIENSLEADDSLGVYDVHVTYRHQLVILKGHVASERDRDRVVEIAKNTDGVKEVKDWLTVSPQSTTSSTSTAMNEFFGVRSDRDIGAEISSAISTDSKSLADKVTISVNDGTATIRGDLKNFREIDQVLSTTLMVAGVRDISSELTVNGRPYRVQTFTR